MKLYCWRRTFNGGVDRVLLSSRSGPEHVIELVFYSGGEVIPIFNVNYMVRAPRFVRNAICTYHMSGVVAATFLLAATIVVGGRAGDFGMLLNRLG